MTLWRKSFFFRLVILFSLTLVLCMWVALDLPCPFRHFTGVPCPSCGMSRAWVAALKLDFASAFSFHPLFWSIPLLVIFFIFGDWAFQKSGKYLLLAFLFTYVICYILRMSAYLKGAPIF